MFLSGANVNIIGRGSLNVGFLFLLFFFSFLFFYITDSTAVSSSRGRQVEVDERGGHLGRL